MQNIKKYSYFVKQSIRNRCNIYGANGKLRLTIPKIREKSNKTIINNIKIALLCLYTKYPKNKRVKCRGSNTS